MTIGPAVFFTEPHSSKLRKLDQCFYLSHKLEHLTLRYPMASSSSSSLWKFDVFLSFRGEDTRRSFVSFLYKELERKGIRTFKDDKDLERGRSISPELLQAIEQSRFAIVVMSQNYASSGWCLDELLKIMDCQEKGSLIVIPVFYQVEPSQVRRQTGKFAEYFNKHDERENPEKVKRWRNELTKLANISGEHSRNWEDDSKLIDKVTNDILDRLISTTSSDFSNLVGMDVHMKAMYGLLDLESNNEVRIVGIWGMGGVGKTTLAEYVYEKILRHFPTQCFLKNVKRIYQDHGPSRLQEEFLSKNLQGGTAMIRNSYVGSSVIRERFGHRRILLVVDDVDKIEQLDALAKDACWFGPGSRIIITTRDKHLLVANGVKHVYEVKCMMHREALELFSQFAFKEKQPFVGLERVSLRAIQLAGGLPLALKVFGSFLRGRPREDWESALHRLGTSLDRGILEILKISYDGLDEQEKSIFLHIACLFNGELVDRVTRLLKNGVQNVQNAKFGIKVLAEKSLVIISSGGYIIVHDLVIKMGRELLRQQSIDRPGKCKILWEPNEIHDVLMYNRGSKAIEGISLDMAEVDELFISKGAFKRMPNLKFLKIYTSKCGEVTKVHLPVDMNFIARKLRYLKWDGYPSKTLQFRADCLVDLDLQNTKLEKLWEGSPCLGNLKNIDLSGSPNLNEFPDLSKAPNLEKIIASKCISLTEIPSSIASLKKLTRFDLMACKGLKRLPKDMNLKSLETVNLNECSSLKMFPEFSRGITKLYLSWRTRRELPESIGHLSHLVELVIYNCKKLESLPDTIGDLVALKYLSLYDCQTLWKIPKTIWKLKSLEYFGLINGRNITEFPNLPENVTEVRLTGTAIKEIQSRTGDLYYIESSDVSRSKWLKCLPACIYKVKHLQCPNAFDCSSQEPEQICESTRPFEELGFEDTSVRRLHPLSSFCHLKDLWISRAEKLDGVHFCCPPLSNFPALERLDLINLNMLEIPDDLGELKNLQRLDFSGNSFEMVPSSIQQLTKLDTLSVNNCDNLHSLPELPLNIKNLLAHGCVALETISKVLKHTWQVLVLSNCFKLKGEIELMSKHMASMLWNKEFVACLPGSEVPSCFNHRNRGSFLTIRLPRGQFSNELVGFAACIVASIEGHRCVGNLRMRIRWTCQYLRGSYRVSVLNGENFPCGTLDELSRVMEVQSDHLFLFNGHLKWMDFEEAAFDKVVFEFYCADWDEDCLSHVEIKECGVRLHFTRDSEEAGEDYRLHCSPSSFADEQSELKANAQEATPGFLAEHNFEMPSWLSWTRGDCSRELWEQVEAENPANRKRNHQSRDNESMNNEEEIEEPSSKKGKSIVFP